MSEPISPMSTSDETQAKIVKTPTSKPSIALREDPHYRIDYERYPLLRSYVRQDWNTIDVENGGELSELKAGWIELFFDLMYVAAIAHVSHEITHYYEERSGEEHGNEYGEDEGHGKSGALDYLWVGLIEFAILEQVWRDQVTYDTRFINTQLVDTILKLLYMIGVLGMGINLSGEEINLKNFAFSYIITRFIQIIQYAKISLIPRSKAHGILNIVTNIIAIIVPLIFGLTLEKIWDWFYAYLGLFFLHYFLTYLPWIFTSTRIPVNVPHIAERFGLFVMLILGESIINLIETGIEKHKYEHYIIILIAFILVFCLQSLYFDCQPSEHQIKTSNKKHAMRTSGRRGLTFNIAHIILNTSLLGLGVGMKFAADHLDEPHHRYPVDVLLPGYSLFLTMLCLNIIRLTHPFENRNIKIWIFRIICLIIMAILPIFYKHNQFIIMVILTLIILIQTIIDVEGREQRITHKAHQKHEAKHKNEIHRSKTEALNATNRTDTAISAHIEITKHNTMN